MGIRQFWDTLQGVSLARSSQQSAREASRRGPGAEGYRHLSWVAIHIPWDREDDWQAVKEYAGQLGLRIGAVNPNLFQDDAYRFGSLCHFDKAVRQRAVEHVIECIQIAQSVGSVTPSACWLADGTNYPGQDDLRRRRHRLLDSLQSIYAALPAGMRLLIEYKFFEPSFYSTDLPDWGTSLLMARKMRSAG